MIKAETAFNIGICARNNNYSKLLEKVNKQVIRKAKKGKLEVVLWLSKKDEQYAAQLRFDLVNKGYDVEFGRIRQRYGDDTKTITISWLNQ